MSSYFVDMTDVAIEHGDQVAAYAAEAAAIMIRDAVVREIDPGPMRTGQEYPIPGTKATYVASAPGEPPAVREGRYRDSWQFSPAVNVDGMIRAAAFSDEAVGGHALGDILEHGTMYMEPRPHIGRALDKVLPEIKKMVAKI